ncbi:MAG TPA: hypothetical protein VLV16_13755 [Gemmatimonadales bacterium]|nr:hypothetical protein [Gemmatimonadales bacterium]
MSTLVAALSLTGCSDTAAPSIGVPPYLAVVATVVGPGGAPAGTHFDYHVREISGTLDIDITKSLAPRDTLILALPPASYVVELTIPPQCKSREGSQLVLIAEGTNTTMVRYLVLCNTQLTVSVLTDGFNPGPYVYKLTPADGRTSIGLLERNDTLAFEHLPAGPLSVDLGAVPANCIVTTNGGTRQVMMLDSTGGAEVQFLVRCGDLAHRPTVLSAHATYHDGVTGLVFRATDPDRDIDRYIWDLTDCHRNTLLARGGGSVRGGLRGGRTANQDTVTVVTTFEAPLPPSSSGDRCVSLWLADGNGFPSPVVETRLAPSGPGSAPVAVQYNAFLFGTAAVRMDLAAQDADNDYAGVFVAVRLRDGTIGQPDGTPDLVYPNTVGYLGNVAPEIGLSATVTYDKLYSVVVYLLDAQGNFTRLEDPDLFF